MRLLAVAPVVLAAIPLAFADSRTAQIYIQTVGGTSSPVQLAEISYDIATPDSGASVTSYEAPELPESASLVRIGLYDSRANKWTGSTSVASVENFGKGYSPHFLLSVDATKYASGDRNTQNKPEEVAVLGAGFRGVRIDAGQTRDFGPQARLVVTAMGKQPELNKPVVLSPEGKKVEKEEKTFLQKFVRFPSLSRGICADFIPQILVVVGNSCDARDVRRRWRGQVELHEHNAFMTDRRFRTSRWPAP